jgi:hypothetical protein
MQNQYQYRQRHQLFMEFAKETFIRLGITYTLPKQVVEFDSQTFRNCSQGSYLPPPPPSVVPQFAVGAAGYGAGSNMQSKAYKEGVFNDTSPFEAEAGVLDTDGLRAAEKKQAHKTATQEEARIAARQRTVLAGKAFKS